MTTDLYIVTLTDLGSYRVTVAADSPAEAENIGKTILYEEAYRLPAGMTMLNREAEAKAALSDKPPIRRWRVDSTYRLDFSLTVPAATSDEAIVHAKRLYDVYCGPFEFEIGEGRAGPYTAEEVVS